MSTGARIALSNILDVVRWKDAPSDTLEIAGGPHVLASPMPVADLASAAIGAVGLAVAELWRLRTGRQQTIGLDFTAAGLAMASGQYLLLDGRKARDWDPITGYYPTKDGRWLYLHANFPHLRDGLLEILGVPADPDTVETTLTKWTADDFEAAAVARGLCAVKMRSRQEWHREPHSAAIDSLPLIEITRIGDAPPQPFGEGARPLSGIRVLDLTRVIAGPMAGRTLAEHGATVMRIAGPHLPFIDALVMDTGFGKLSAHIDLRDKAGQAQLTTLTRDADVFVNAYRPGSIAARGFGPEALARLRPGIVSASLSAFSRAGPWSMRRGYDSVVQAAVGLSPFDRSGKPCKPPFQALDYITGYLTAFGIMMALKRRAEVGGSWHVELSLARTAHWLQRMVDVLGLLPEAPEANPALDAIAPYVAETQSSFGLLRHLTPALILSETPGRFWRPPVPLGSDPAVWP